MVPFFFHNIAISLFFLLNGFLILGCSEFLPLLEQALTSDLRRPLWSFPCGHFFHHLVVPAPYHPPPDTHPSTLAASPTKCFPQPRAVPAHFFLFGSAVPPFRMFPARYTPVSSPLGGSAPTQSVLHFTVPSSICQVLSSIIF